MEDEIELPMEPVGEIEVDEVATNAEKIEVDDRVYWGFSIDPSMTPSDALMQWYANLPSQRLDLVSELGDSRGVFVVNGESLLVHVIEQLCGGSETFSQDKLFLTAIFYVERYIDMFLQAKSGIKQGVRIVFFDALCPLLSSISDSVALAREILRSHLSSSLGSHIVHTFSDWSSESFRMFVQDTDISSFIVSDELDFAPDFDSENEEDRMLHSLFLSLSLHLVTAYRLRIAFMDQLEQRGHRIVAFSIGAERRHEAVHSLVTEAIAPFFEQIRAEKKQDMDLGENISVLAVLAKAAQLTLEDMEDMSSREAQLVVSVLKTIMLSAAVTQSLTLEDRCMQTVSHSDWESFEFFDQVWCQLAQHLAVVIGSISPVSLPDLFDGRVFRTVAFILHKAGWREVDTVLGLSGDVIAEVESAWSTSTNTGSVFDLGTSLMTELGAPLVDSLPKPTMEAYSATYMAFTHPIRLLERAKSVAASLPGGSSIVSRVNSVPLVNVDEQNNHQLIGSYIPETQLVTKRFEEKKKRDYDDQKAKWKHLSIDKLANRMRTWELRSAQKELRAMHQYAKSLSGADSLHHAIALVQEGKSNKQEEETGVKFGKKALEIIARNKAAQEKTQANKDSDQIKPLLDRAESLASDSRDWNQFQTGLLDLCAGYSRIVDSFDQFRGICSSVKLESSQVKVITAIVKGCKSVLKRLAPSATGHLATEEAKYSLRTGCAKILRLCVSFIQEFAPHIEGKDMVRVQELLLSMGFSHTSKSLFQFWSSAKHVKEQLLSDSKKVDLKKKKDDQKKNDTTALDEYYVKSSKIDPIVDITGGDEYLFQLVHLSSELDRPAGTQSDKRVVFKPDYWQKELLDIVDRGESALVCAPTASGKTFICYYAMERVLRSSNDKVAVYVAPSKALMNQVDAEIYARFRSKTYPATGTHFQLAGDLEKDYQHHPFDCQVLVTVPTMLEQLLLDPTMQDYVRRIEYVIFDEVHCMGENAEEAAIWEHALQLIPCPFLAMSATVGNPSRFRDWLSYVSRLKGGPPVHLIEYKERFNDLQKLAFSENDKALLGVHPLTLLSFEDACAGIVPPDLAMTPAETAVLATALKHIDEDAKVAPRKVFGKLIAVDTMITKKQFREYEKHVLNEFVRLSESGRRIDKGKFDELQKSLSQSARVGEPKSLNDLWLSMIKPSSKESSRLLTTVNVLSQALGGQEESIHYLDGEWLYKFLNQLDAYALLPGIIFNLDRAEIVKMVERLSTFLKQGQWEKYYGTEERAYATRGINKKRMEAYEAKLNRQRMMERKNRKDDDFDEAEISENVPPPVLVEDEFDPEYSFAGVKALSDMECHDLINKLAESKKIKPYIIEGLRRGIGMHHEGCSTRLKKTVEILFRRGFLRIVIATSTLALGINMPCKSTIFVGTHVKLNAINFRQMAGRAGRRGFDLVGQVIFVDSNHKNVKRLLTSELSQLGGDFALTPSHVLRAQVMMDHLIQTNGLTDKLERHIMAMLLGGFMPFNLDASASSIAIVRSNLDFLLREGLLSADGQVTRLGSLAAFLFKREPENMIIARVLLSRDLLTEIDSWIGQQVADRPVTSVTFRLMQVLSAFCFGKPLLRGAKRRTIPDRKKLQPTETCPVQPDLDTFLPESLCNIREQFNQRVIDNVVGRVIVMTDTSGQNAHVLPASGKKIGPHATRITPDSIAGRTVNGHKKGASLVRSIFSAIGGKDDKFISSLDLVMSANQRASLMLDSASVPTVRTGLMSSYACDFLLHGKLSLLQNDCLIGISESWKEIDDWRFFLESLNIALEYMFELDNTHEYAHLQKVVRDLTTELSAKLQLEGA